MLNEIFPPSSQKGVPAPGALGGGAVGGAKRAGCQPIRLPEHRGGKFPRVKPCGVEKAGTGVGQPRGSLASGLNPWGASIKIGAAAGPLRGGPAPPLGTAKKIPCTRPGSERPPRGGTLALATAPVCGCCWVRGPNAPPKKEDLRKRAPRKLRHMEAFLLTSKTRCGPLPARAIICAKRSGKPLKSTWKPNLRPNPSGWGTLLPLQQPWKKRRSFCEAHGDPHKTGPIPFDRPRGSWGLAGPPRAPRVGRKKLPPGLHPWGLLQNWRFSPPAGTGAAAPPPAKKRPDSIPGGKRRFPVGRRFQQGWVASWPGRIFWIGIGQDSVGQTLDRPLSRPRPLEPLFAPNVPPWSLRPNPAPGFFEAMGFWCSKKKRPKKIQGPGVMASPRPELTKGLGVFFFGGAKKKKKRGTLEKAAPQAYKSETAPLLAPAQTSAADEKTASGTRRMAGGKKKPRPLLVPMRFNDQPLPGAPPWPGVPRWAQTKKMPKVEKKKIRFFFSGPPRRRRGWPPCVGRDATLCFRLVAWRPPQKGCGRLGPLRPPPLLIGPRVRPKPHRAVALPRPPSRGCLFFSGGLGTRGD